MEVAYREINERSAGVTKAKHNSKMEKRVAKKIRPNERSVGSSGWNFVFDLKRGIHLTRQS
jgi:hypothetical protein